MNNNLLSILTVLAPLIPGLLAFFDINFFDIISKFKGGIPKGFIIFISGTNGVGKTTTALEIQKKLGMRYIHVNVLREALRSQEELFKKAGNEALYNILKEPSYLLDNPNNSYEIIESDFQKQCEILGPVITRVAKYYYEEKLNTVFEGINISPKILQRSGFSSLYVLFIYLCVTDKDEFNKRLDKKAGDDAEKRNIYRQNIDKIIDIGNIIKKDFESVDDKDRVINKLYIDNTALSVKKVTRKIIKEVRKICNLQ